MLFGAVVPKSENSGYTGYTCMLEYACIQEYTGYTERGKCDQIAIGWVKLDSQPAPF